MPQNHKLWGGRFVAEASDWVNAFGASISFDQRLAKYDIKGSLAHVAMLKQCHIIPQTDADKITAGLQILLDKAQKHELQFDVACEDIHMNIEQLLTEQIGPVAGKLHTARSRNDQVALDTHLYLIDQLDSLKRAVWQLEDVIVTLASQNITTIMPGYTHLQHAQPISFAHHLMAYFQMFCRDFERLAIVQERTSQSPLGACALAGTTFPIDREMTAKALNLNQPYTNSLDAVSDRDFILEFLAAASIMMMHASRFCEEIINWCSHEYQFISLADEFATGSSIMPQKKNPDMAELIRGKSGRVFGNLMGLLTTMKGLPLAYNKDLQEDKEKLFDTVDTTLNCTRVLAAMLKAIHVNKDKMKQACTHDFSNATELADYLATLGVPFRQAHAIVGKLVLQCINEQKTLSDISLAQYQQLNAKITAEVYHVLTPEVAVERRTSLGACGFDQVKKQINAAKVTLAAQAK